VKPRPTLPISKRWKGVFYDNRFLAGDPVLVRRYAYLRFNWGTGSLHKSVPSDNFSARWIRDQWFAAGSYEVTVDVDDGARVWIDGRLVLDAWDQLGRGAHTELVALRRGRHSLRVEYRERRGNARLRFSIRKVSDDDEGGDSDRDATVPDATYRDFAALDSP